VKDDILDYGVLFQHLEKLKQFLFRFTYRLQCERIEVRVIGFQSFQQSIHLGIIGEGTVVGKRRSNISQYTVQRRKKETAQQIRVFYSTSELLDGNSTPTASVVPNPHHARNPENGRHLSISDTFKIDLHSLEREKGGIPYNPAQ
jgi:hypothetical protein